ncbi:hypothetical protein [Bradyrhizobium sp. DASA03120]|uniref:hypothetical protein n=1 Tax=Bradyrhizobium sp. SMVTL-02 TaxID=3395917 RepID=UPI003F716BFF
MMIFPSGNVDGIHCNFNRYFPERENRSSISGELDYILPNGKIPKQNAWLDHELYRSGNLLAKRGRASAVRDQHPADRNTVLLMMMVAGTIDTLRRPSSQIDCHFDQPQPIVLSLGWTLL